MTTVASSRYGWLARVSVGQPVTWWWNRLMIIGFGVLVALGVTTSSIGVPGLLDEPSQPAPGLILGSPDPIRSDEYLRGSPWLLGVMRTGGDDFGTPLSHPDPSLVASKVGGPVTSALFPETALARVVGEDLTAQFFALGWWLPIAALLLCLPSWFRRFGVRPAISLPATLLLVLSPVSVWWSLGTTAILGWAALAAVAAMAAADRLGSQRKHWWTATALLGVAGLALARLALSYQPWAIPLGAGVLLPALGWILRSPMSRRSRAFAAVMPLTIGLIALGAFLLEHSDAAAVLAETVYPGTRRFTGAMSSVAVLLGAPHLWVLQRGPEVAATNYSEISSGYTVLGAVALILAVAVPWRRVRSETLAAVVTCGGTLGALSVWSLVDWPDSADVLFPLSVVGPDRLAQVIGLLATLTFGLVLEAWWQAAPPRPRSAWLASALVAFLLTGIGGSQFRDAHLPSYRASVLLLVSVLVSLAVLAAVVFVRRRWALVPSLVLAMAVTGAVSPVQRGLGDLDDGESARAVQRVESQVEGNWVTDSVFVDALLMANGIPSASGQQWVGPDDETWGRLGLPRTAEDLWNRGAAFVNFTWGAAGSPTSLTLPQADFLVLTVDPCGDALDQLDVAIVVTAADLNQPCLTEQRRFTLGGADYVIYRRTSAGAE